MKRKRVLAELRPTTLAALVGQDALKDTLERQLESGRLPHLFVIGGPTGSGKTTLARILARRIDGFTQELNAANTNGVDDMRRLVESMQYKPLPPHKSRTVILDEAHQLTVPAQNVLLTEVEDAPEHVFYIFCTSNPGKLIAPLRRRAFLVTPQPLDAANVSRLRPLGPAAQREQLRDARGTHQPIDPSDALHQDHEHGDVLRLVSVPVLREPPACILLAAYHAPDPIGREIAGPPNPIIVIETHHKHHWLSGGSSTLLHWKEI